jgi:hypothetical protein
LSRDTTSEQIGYKTKWTEWSNGYQTLERVMVFVSWICYPLGRWKNKKFSAVYNTHCLLKVAFSVTWRKMKYSRFFSIYISNKVNYSLDSQKIQKKKLYVCNYFT